MTVSLKSLRKEVARAERKDCFQEDLILLWKQVEEYVNKNRGGSYWELFVSNVFDRMVALQIAYSPDRRSDLDMVKEYNKETTALYFALDDHGMYDDEFERLPDDEVEEFARDFRRELLKSIAKILRALGV